MFIARQPIFDRVKKVYGYELLFRAGENSLIYSDSSAENSTATVLGGLFELGIEKIVGNSKAFVNFDYNFLMSEAIELINPEKMVLEILENTKADDKLIKRVKELKKIGYKTALDDFEEDIDEYPLVDHVDIIKYDLIVTPLSTIEYQVKKALKRKKILLAEKIETEEEFEVAKKMGFHLFQGYFFSKPQIVGGVKNRITANQVYQRLFVEINKEEPSFGKLAEIIQTDVNMAYKVLKLIHHRKGENEKTTIKRAIANIGLREMERWIHVLMMQDIASDKPPELIRLSLLRSKFGELIAMDSKFKNYKYDVSLMMLFSVLDAITGLTMNEALEGVSVSDDVKEALINKTGPFKNIYEIVINYELGNWEKLFELASAIKIKSENIFMFYVQAINWSNGVMNYIK